MDYPTAEAALKKSFGEVSPGLDDPTLTKLARAATNTLHALGRLTAEPASGETAKQPHPATTPGKK